MLLIGPRPTNTGRTNIQNEAAAETAGGGVAHPVPVLHDRRIAQPELNHAAGPFGGTDFDIALRPEQRDQRIARQYSHHHEDDDGHAENR